MGGVQGICVLISVREFFGIIAISQIVYYIADMENLLVGKPLGIESTFVVQTKQIISTDGKSFCDFNKHIN